MTDAERKSLPGALLNVVLAAHRAGDRGMERSARTELLERYGIRLVLLEMAHPHQEAPK